MRYLTGEELRKTLGWWLVLALFAAGVGVTYMRTLESSPFGHVTSRTNATYDYIIVGGGAEGCVLATRLSEDPRVSVLLLEAGGEETVSMWNHVPLWSPIRPGSKQDWGFSTTPQKFACKSMKQKKCPVLQPKVLGGSSLTSSMLYTRASKYDFASWPQDKAKTWSYENILPYYFKSEDMLDEDLKISDRHSTNGPLPVSGVQKEMYLLHDMFLEGARELKNKPIDCNGLEGVGFCRLYTTVHDGDRFSSAKDFLRPVLSRRNLHVSTHSTVIKILITNRRAVGVDYVRNGDKKTVGGSRDVIVTAGAIGTAQLLLLSGIGPKDQLTKQKIPCLADLPVGSNLQEHLLLKLDIQTNESVGITRENAFNALSYLHYMTLGKGLLSTSGGVFGNALLRTDVTSSKNRPDIQLTFSAIADDLGKEDNGENDKNKHSSGAGNTTSGQGFTIIVELLRPDSRGSVLLGSANPFTQPKIDPNYLFNPKDIQMMIKGIKIALSFLSTAPFRAMKARVREKPYPSCIEHRFKSDGYWECLLRHIAVGNGQATSTCPLGSIGSPKTVVDTNLRVMNISNLRISDASVFPSSVSGDLMATRVMFAEKAADLIRGHESIRFYRKLANRALKNS
ncbi:glucose dehydrogenase [FAD, quinone]-like [Mya arenaria]|uniref:glucose dehydrogenase [FAD, quinone]-like n=1 Tax=Mya arenaria TaxID=6604 RepID=UPI0022E27819|nr:glucose dehydrogenase [FAD, quinone]-like [Mya arenaria]